MVVKRVLLLTFILLMISLSPFLPFSISGKAQEYSTSWVDATFEFRFLNGTHLDLKLKLDVHNMTVYNRIYGADEIREMYHQGEGAAFRAKIFDCSMDVLDKVFNNCKVDLDIPYEDSSTLNIPKDSDLYNPPLTFYIDGNVTLSSNFFGSDIENIQDFVNGLLDIGARIRYDFSFFAPPLWNISYVFKIPDYLSVKEVNRGDISVDGKEVVWEIQNYDGKDEKVRDGYLVIEEVDPTSYFEEESINANITFDMSKIKTTLLEVSLDVKSLDVSNVVSFPDFVDGIQFLPSDGIRLLIENGLISLDDLQNLLEDKWLKFERDFISSLGKNITFNVCVDANTTINCSQPYNTSHMDTYPPLVVKGTGKLEKLLDNISTRAILGIIYSGGKVKIDKDLINLSKLEYPFEAKIILPYGENYSWNKSKNLNITVSYDSAPNYTTEKKERILEVYVKDIDLDLLDLVTGKSNVVSSLDIRDNLIIYRIYAHSLLSPPDWIDLKIINSDLFRLLIEEGLLDAELNGFLKERLNLSNDLMVSLVKQNNLKTYLDEKSFEESLSWDRDIKKMGDEKPISISFFSTVTKKAKFSFSIIPFSFTIMNESFDCFSVPGENVTYRFIFPKDVEVSFNDSLGRCKGGVLDDGRKYIEIKFSENDGLVTTTVYYSLGLSPLRIVLLLLPIIIMILVIVIIVSILVLMGRRRKFRPKVSEYREISDEQAGNFRQ